MGFWKRRIEELQARGFGDVDGAICLEHVEDEALIAHLVGQATERECIVCDRVASEADLAFAVPFEDLLLEISTALLRHYSDADDEGVPWDSEDGCYIGAATYEIDDIINEVCDGAFGVEIYDDLVEKVAEAFDRWTTWTDSRGAYSLDALDWEWESFVRTVQSRSRFVFVANDGSDHRGNEPRRLAAFLSRLDAYVDGQLDLIDVVAPGAVFYRGRLMDAPDAIQPECESLQPAPPTRASANRMSPAGIPMFYASADVQTAIAEIAGHGPEPYALVGAFRSTTSLRLLDLTRQPKLPSYFDREKHHEFGMARFLASFVGAITRPIIPDGRQHIEYTPTQVLTEYLRWIPHSHIDGIALPSAQTGAKTYVLYFDGDAFADATDTVPTHPLVVLPPTFTLAKEDIATYEVERRYKGRKWRSC